MIPKLLLTFLTTILLLSCGSNKSEVPNTDMDVAKAFINDVLKNDLKNASGFILQDSTNKALFDLFKKNYESHSKTELENFKNADIIINSIEPVTDSITIINYSNSYKMKNNNIVKMVKVNDQWQVDFKYTISGNF